MLYGGVCCLLVVWYVRFPKAWVTVIIFVQKWSWNLPFQRPFSSVLAVGGVELDVSNVEIVTEGGGEPSAGPNLTNSLGKSNQPITSWVSVPLPFVNLNTLDQSPRGGPSRLRMEYKACQLSMLVESLVKRNVCRAQHLNV